MQLNKEELLSGAVIASAWCWFMGWWSFLAIPLCGFFWALGGTKSKIWRRIGVPATILGCTFQLTGDLGVWLLASLAAFFGCLTIGYGIPTWDEHGNKTDGGSWLGARVYDAFGGAESLLDTGTADLATYGCRAIIGGLIGLSLLPLAWISEPMWFVGLIVCIIGYPLVRRLTK